MQAFTILKGFQSRRWKVGAIQLRPHSSKAHLERGIHVATVLEQVLHEEVIHQVGFPQSSILLCLQAMPL